MTSSMSSHRLRIADFSDEPTAVDADFTARIALVEPRSVADDDQWNTPVVTTTTELSGATHAAPGRSWSGRLFALTLLIATLVGLVWAGAQVYLVLTDAWIAPLHLSPQSEVVAQLRLQHQRSLAEQARLDAEVTRLDGELEAIDTAVARLSELRGSSQATLAWQAEHSRVEAGGLDSATGLLRRQIVQLGKLHTRQVTLVARARADLDAGVIDRAAFDREEQIRDQLELERIELERQLAEATVLRTHNRAALRALRAGTGQGGAPAVGQMPEVAAGEEHAARVELEIQKLLAEQRGHRALRAAAVASVATQRALLAELEGRPLYRAMTNATDIAFVPYDQLAGVQPGARIMDCTWAVFRCHEVGRITEILPGEVVTQDPWGEMARGQFAILALADTDAIRERVLRVRR